MEATRSARCVLKYLRVGPRKMRLVVNEVRHKNALQAVEILKFTKKKAARFILAGLNSAIANARNKKLDENSLVISEIKADEGPMFKRFMPRSMGRADRILKRTSHLTLVVSEGKKKITPIEAPEAKEKKEIKKPKQAKASKSIKKPVAKKKATAKKKVGAKS